MDFQFRPIVDTGYGLDVASSEVMDKLHLYPAQNSWIPLQPQSEAFKAFVLGIPSMAPVLESYGIVDVCSSRV